MKNFDKKQDYRIRINFERINSYMRILYGIQLNGNGHITRSLEIIRNLKNNEHIVDIIVSGKNFSLDIEYPVLKRFDGFSLFFNKKGKINWFNTILNSNIFKLIKDSKFDCSEYDLVISDFEPITSISAIRHKKKSIGIANQYSIENKIFSKNILSELFIKYFAKCKYQIPISYSGSYLPVISEDILNGEVCDENYYLVYLPTHDIETIKKTFENTNFIFKVYSKEVSEKFVWNNIEFNKPDKNKFQKDLLNCSGVITASGFSTTSECLVIGKKLWSIPLKQIEQIKNARELNSIGVFTEKFSRKNLMIWVRDYKKVDYNWKNPINKIIEEIKTIYEN